MVYTRRYAKVVGGIERYPHSLYVRFLHVLEGCLHAISIWFNLAPTSRTNGVYVGYHSVADGNEFIIMSDVNPEHEVYKI